MDEYSVAINDPIKVVHKDRQKILLVWCVLFLTFALGVITWRMYEIQKQVVALESNVESINYDLYILSSDLSSVSAIANNANMWAHSHSYSDERLKSSLATIDDPVGKLLMINGGYFNWNDKASSLYHLNGRELGVLAQDVEVVFPELVYQDSNGYKQVDYSRLTAVLIEAIRQQQREIENVELRLLGIETER
jgi:hypothetical protein